MRSTAVGCTPRCHRLVVTRLPQLRLRLCVYCHARLVGLPQFTARLRCPVYTPFTYTLHWLLHTFTHVPDGYVYVLPLPFTRLVTHAFCLPVTHHTYGYRLVYALPRTLHTFRFVHVAGYARLVTFIRARFTVCGLIGSDSLLPAGLRFWLRGYTFTHVTFIRVTRTQFTAFGCGYYLRIAWIYLRSRFTHTPRFTTAGSYAFWLRFLPVARTRTVVRSALPVRLRSLRCTRYGYTLCLPHSCYVRFPT